MVVNFRVREISRDAHKFAPDINVNLKKKIEIKVFFLKINIKITFNFFYF